MRGLVVVTQVVDSTHPLLAATVPKLRALAARVDELVVLADGAVPAALPANARVLPFAARSRARRGARFAAALAREVGRRRPVGVLAHMCPIYAVLAAPLARPLGVPVLLWYAHPHASPTLRAAERVATRVLSVDERSFPLPSRKLVPIGHGIDVDRYRCRGPERRERLRMLALGRYAAVKGYADVLRAVAAVPAAELAIHGPSSNDAEARHRGELERLVDELGVGDRVLIGDAVPPDEVPALLAGADALVSATRAGSADKAVLEACASCVPVVSTEGAFGGLLPAELRFPAGNVEALAERLRHVGGLDLAERARLGARLRDAVAAGHSVETWAERVLAAAS